ncbi:MAG: DUF2207 domain-containing protein [Bacteroidetes bacterium]|nr:DUF2207 domain-containing protein [Bacteroidota bacterium]
MKKFSLWCICILCCLHLAAQKPPVYNYTAASERFFTDGEMDSLLQANTNELFNWSGIPDTLFKKKYPLLKPLLTASIKKETTNAFYKLERENKALLKAVPGSDAYLRMQRIYTGEWREVVKNAFNKMPGLRNYIQFNNSDRITNFNSLVVVLPDGKLRVTETITIYNGDGRMNPLYANEKDLLPPGAGNNEIQRGIVRTFPLYYINRYKLFQNTTFKMLQVRKDGKEEDYHTTKKNNGILLYIGNKNRNIANGKHTYTIEYETANQLKYLKDFDELYWNVTGNGWSFLIESATCTVVLPNIGTVLSSRCYTGPQGSTSEECLLQTIQSKDSSRLMAYTQKPLPPNHGITIAVSWPKGLIKGPGTWAKMNSFIWNNQAVFLLPIAAIISAIFCFIFWWKYGRDPEKGTIYPQFEPPAGYSPAALGYIYDKKHTRKLTAATIVDAAVRNKISINVEREGTLFKHNEYHIKSAVKEGKKISAAYEDFYSDIEDLVNTTIRKGKYNSELGDLNTAIEKYCQTNYKNKDGGFKKGYRGFFATNAKYTAIPIILCILTGGWAFYELMRAMVLKNFWQAAYFIGGIILCVRVLNIFSRLLTAYSPEGRKLMDKIEGFRMFLSTADESRLDMMNPPEKTLELYEKYLPFAIALGCDIAWGHKFENIINTAYLDGKATSSFSHSMSRDNDSFSSSFGSAFGGAISSASTPPSSSSGGGSSFGGGSSGGGGGGGGGGGW